MRATLLTAAALAAVLGGCRQQQASGATIPRQRFVLANVDVRSIPDTVANGDSLRKAALKKRHVTEADLRRFVDAHARSPEYLATVWREVADSVQKRYERTFPARADSSRPGDAIPGMETPQPMVPGGPPRAVVPSGPPGSLPAVVRKPPPPPDQPPPPVTEPPRTMVREMPPTRRPPVDPPPDARRPMTRPGQRPVAPIDSLDRR
jgi:hypothetical protein